MTEKLYYKDAYLKEFTATVVSCIRTDNLYETELDMTAFFPEGGGQSSDTGYIDDSFVSDVREKDGKIIHLTDRAFDYGTVVCGKINWDRRFRNMQNHSGEHIVSGLIHSSFGYNNVGFHIGSNGVTVDIDHELSEEDIRMIETEANTVVVSNTPVVAEFPTDDELEKMSYRSKLELTENVRIVTIGEYDTCACCAPHVSRTGEIGLIKILDTERYKGGTRIQMLCGFDALEDYNTRYRNTAEISALLSAKQPEVSEAVKRLAAELNEEKRLKTEIKKELMALKLQGLKERDGNMCVFDDKCDMNDLRAIVNEGIKKCKGICAAFSGSDKSGYKYVIASSSENIGKRASEINKALDGRGGGSAMIQGSVSASRDRIESYITAFE
ncbi:MAG: hypothetical protein E7505_02605 [Ruminococcus sp.]|nr:hypothetical protein [Ruminococcus sp.]